MEKRKRAGKKGNGEGRVWRAQVGEEPQKKREKGADGCQVASYRLPRKGAGMKRGKERVGYEKPRWEKSRRRKEEKRVWQMSRCLLTAAQGSHEGVPGQEAKDV
jgi:hypothetical protein